MDHHFFPVSSISFMLCLCYFLKFTVHFDDPAAYLPDDVSITCGSVGTSAAHSGRQWLGDTHPIVASSVQIKGKSTISTVACDSVSSAHPIPYKSARISRSGFAYVFLVSPGEKFIRLHFNPTPYKGFQKYKDLFTVEAGPFTLLRNFSVSLTADALGLTSIIKEFYVRVQENQLLHIVFTPTSSLSGETYVFLNGIEIITVPLGHSYFHADGDIGAQVLGRRSQHIYVDNSTALEMVRRVNIKQAGSVSSGDDVTDIFGMWGTVPGVRANQINNITWKIPVDVGFRYLIRLYFSNLGLKFLQETGSVKLDVLINGVSAYKAQELVRERDTDNIIAYKDYIVMLNGHKDGVKHDILVSLQTYSEFVDKYGPFTGFEILKLSNHDNSLACPNPWHPARDLQSKSFQTLHSALGHRNYFVTISIIVIALACTIIHKLREIWEASFTEEENEPSCLCRRFSLTEMQLATENFSYHLIIGHGGFGKVYKGLIDHGKEIAIKRLKPSSSQGAHEFFAEIETLSELRHINIVSLIGYCNEQMEMILVYEYMAGGTLGDHLHKLGRKGSSCASLTWKQRLNICIGAGRGLDYLHTGHRVIHRDVKSSNILLDENLTPKFSDFGLVKHENLCNLQSHVSTMVKGTFGYLDPTYFRTGKLTRKSDVYAFGVVLLEVLCGRPVIDPKVSKAERILCTWAQEKIREGEVELIVDLNLKQEISPNSLEAFVEIVERCLDNEPKKRPTMAQVVVQLEFSLEQQDTVELSVLKLITIDASCTDETNLSAGEQATWIDEPIPISPQKEQINNQIDTFTAQDFTTHADYDDLSYQRKKGWKVSSYKPSRIWPWDALRKRVKLSRKFGNSVSEICEEDINLPKYEWLVIESATNHFSSSYMIGGSGDGPKYYKAVFHSGKILAVKIFSTSREVIKKILMVQKLRHRNILKLKGYCIHKGNMILVHDFMENKSLDKFIFGKCQHLRWTQRFNIIMGIARGLSYLHRMRIIYRDLKPSHILLDINMNPKISDLESAKSLEEEVSDEYTSSHVSPENSLNFKISTMSDVYSFGVVVLEIVSGSRYIHDSPQNTVTTARKLWLEENPLGMVDASIRGDEPADQLEEEDKEEFLRCIKVGLLCTQFELHRRPTMPCVIRLLEAEESVNPQEMEFLSLQEQDRSCNRDEDWTPNVSPHATQY